VEQKAEEVRQVLNPREALLKDCLCAMPSAEFIERSQEGEWLARMLFQAQRVNIKDAPQENYEFYSWHASLRAFGRLLGQAGLRDQYVILEYCFPRPDEYTLPKRLDVMVLGKDTQGKDTAALVELKQWQANILRESKKSEMIWIQREGKPVEVPHPCKQPLEYDIALHELFLQHNLDDEFLITTPYLYLHNIRKKPSASQLTALFGSKSYELRDYVKLYTGNFLDCFAQNLRTDVGGGKGEQVVMRLERLSILRRRVENPSTSSG